MVKQVLKDIWIIKIPLPGNPLKDLNSYFIRGEQRNLLIDTGFNSEVCYKALKTGLDELEADMGNTDIFLTHLHTDHTGLCARIASKNSKIYISETDEKYLVDFLKEDYWNTFVYNRSLSFGFSSLEIERNNKCNPIRLYAPPKETKYTTVGDGFEIDLGKIRLRAIATPGHTPGHMCLYEEKRSILFCGDHIIYDITPNITPWNGVENALGMYLESLQKTAQMNPKRALSAHRIPIGNCTERIAVLITHHRNRIEEAYLIVSGFPGLTAYEIASRMTWSIRAGNWGEFPVMQKWFAVGEAAAHLEYLLCEGRIKRESREGKYVYYSSLE